MSSFIEDMRETRAERDYEVAWARFHGDARVIEDVEELAQTGAHRGAPLQEVLTCYRYWREDARARLDQTTELFPEFVSATQDRLAGRLALQAERDAIDARVQSGAIPRSVAIGMVEDLERRADEIGTSRTGKLAVDPEELLRKVPFFQGLPRDEFRQVSSKLHRRTAPGGDLIVKQGERGSSLFLVARGVVRVVRRDDEVDTDIATLMAGDFFGEMALLHGGIRTATCRAVTPCALYELARSDIDTVIQSCPAMKEALQDADQLRRAELRAAGAILGDDPTDA